MVVRILTLRHACGTQCYLTKPKTQTKMLCLPDRGCRSGRSWVGSWLRRGADGMGRSRSTCTNPGDSGARRGWLRQWSGEFRWAGHGGSAAEMRGRHERDRQRLGLGLRGNREVREHQRGGFRSGAARQGIHHGEVAEELPSMASGLKIHGRVPVQEREEIED